MMAFVQWCVLLLSVAAAISVNADMTVDCNPDSVMVVWTEHKPHVDMSLFRLGSCYPTRVTAREVVFNVDFNECNFKKLVTASTLMYFSELLFISSPDSHVLPHSHLVVCEYERPKDYYPEIYEPVFSTYDTENLIFNMQLMNDFFSGPAKSTSFTLGSIIPIMASVRQASHQPLLLLLEECEASSTPDQRPGSSFHTIINNKGCLVDSKESRSKFEPRQKSSELRLSLQAFKFASGEEVFLHCTLVAWEPSGLDHTKKACHYVKDQGWESLDTPYSSLCDCCESTCKSRRTRSLTSAKHGIAHKVMLGPLQITDF
ncbi:zona pellucida sperm-binding protein 3-like [Gouania willdenowi]|nr:zona pellucida sperm-binding protein 3-like [Gouania willdenowi]